MKTLILKKYGNEYPMTFKTSNYSTNGNLYVGLVSHADGFPEPWSDLTVNLSTKCAPNCAPNCAFIDVNNNGTEIIHWLVENGLGELKHRIEHSGFCIYPEFEFNMERLMEFVD